MEFQKALVLFFFFVLFDLVFDAGAVLIVCLLQILQTVEIVKRDFFE